MKLRSGYVGWGPHDTCNVSHHKREIFRGSSNKGKKWLCKEINKRNWSGIGLGLIDGWRGMCGWKRLEVWGSNHPVIPSRTDGFMEWLVTIPEYEYDMGRMVELVWRCVCVCMRVGVIGEMMLLEPPLT